MGTELDNLKLRRIRSRTELLEVGAEGDNKYVLNPLWLLQSVTALGGCPEPLSWV